MNRGPVRPQLRGALPVRERLVELTKLPAGSAEIHVRIDELRVRFKRGLRGGDRLGGALQVEQNAAELEMRGGPAGTQLNCAAQMRFRRGGVGAAQGTTEVEPGRRIIGIQFHGLPEAGQRIGGAAEAAIGLPEIVGDGSEARIEFERFEELLFGFAKTSEVPQGDAKIIPPLRFRRIRGDRAFDQLDGLRVFAALRVEHADELKRGDVFGFALEHLAVTRLRFRETAGAMMFETSLMELLRRRAIGHGQ